MSATSHVLGNLVVFGSFAALFAGCVAAIVALGVKHHSAKKRAEKAEARASALEAAKKAPRSMTEIGMAIAERAAKRTAELVKEPPQSHPATGVLAEKLGEEDAAVTEILRSLGQAAVALEQHRTRQVDVLEEHRKAIWGETGRVPKVDLSAVSAAPDEPVAPEESTVVASPSESEPPEAA